MSFSRLEWVAIVLLSYIALNLIWIVLRFLFTTYVGSWLRLNVRLDRYGPWAVVTGATDGIGKAYAKQLAMAGLHVVIVSRSPNKLEVTAQEIRALNPFVQVKTIAVDFTEEKSIYKFLANELAGLEIGILINNVGMNVGFCQPFAELPSEKSVYDIINCNVVSMVRMTQMILPQMVHRRRGIIINVSSFAGAVPCPLGILYSATKSFIDSFSRGLSTEVRSSGVIVQTVLPGFVLTNMASQNSNINETSPMVPNPDDYVKANFRTLGLESRSPCFWFHKIQLWWAELGNFTLPAFTSFIIMKSLSALRRENQAYTSPVTMK